MVFVKRVCCCCGVSVCVCVLSLPCSGEFWLGVWAAVSSLSGPGLASSPVGQSEENLDGPPLPPLKFLDPYPLPPPPLGGAGQVLATCPLWPHLWHV